MIRAVVRFIFVVIIVCFLAYLLDALVKLVPFVPEPIAAILHILIWGLAIIIILWQAWITFAPLLPAGP